ncbi:hypothetical protein O988_05396 [Pseudogymnoascus sp. VKM F-3808]|nr:hypothetical protein O988_05396 [Pseudogymnoascus sp. VKM F-3808]
MAPRRGGGGGFSSGGSSSCDYCLEEMQLFGYRWQNSKVTGLFAMQIILIPVLVACIMLTVRFKWIRERGTDKLRNRGFVIAAVFLIIDFLLRVITTGLQESEAVVTHLFYLAYIFQVFFSRIGYVLIVAIIARTITEDVGVLSQKLTTFAVGLFWVISLVDIGFAIAWDAELMAMGYVEEIAVLGSLYMDILLSSYLFAFTLFLSVLAILAMIKRRSKGTLLMLVGVIPALFLMTLIDLALQGAAFDNRTGKSDATKSLMDLSYANSFINVLATMAIFVVIAIIGGLRQRSDANGLTQDPKYAQPGPHYVAVGPYAPPPAPYNPHGTQLPDGQQAAYGAPQQPGQPQPFQYAQPQYGQAGQQQQYAQYPALGQFAPQQQHAEMSNTPAQAAATTTSPVHYAAPVAVSPAQYGAPSSSSVSPPPQHDPYQTHVQH